MKKLISFLTAAAMLTSLTANTVFAEEEEVDPLREIAASFGAKTDYFLFPNYSTLVSASDKDSRYVEFFKRCNNTEAFNSPAASYAGTLGGGRCLGISILEILSHNGVISPSDIYDGAQYLTDIPKDLDNGRLDNIISHYQALQLYTELELYMRWFMCKYSNEEKVKILLDTAKKATENSKYFLIVLQSTKLYHSVAGIGMVDGEWTFEGETYDKCILTLDSNVIKAEFFPQEKIAWGFHEGTSIYVNSNTNKIYIPEYCENGYGDDLTVTVIDDESLLNYKGLLNPSEKVETDLSLINKIDIESDGEYSITVTDLDGITYDGKNNIRERFSPSYFCDGKSFRVENIDGSNLSANFTDISHSAMVDARGNITDIYKDAAEIKLTSNGETEYDFDLVFNEDSYDFSPHCRFHLSGVTQSGVSVKQTDRGIIVSGEEGVTCKLSVYDVGFDNEKYIKEINTNEQNDALCIANNMLISFDDNGKICYFIGDNYDTEVKRGDVNCDGVIDAIDASYVLSGYANASCNKPSYVGNILGDYNNDGVSDAVDASQILSYYSEQSVSNK